MTGPPTCTTRPAPPPTWARTPFNPATGTPIWEHGAAPPVIAALAYANGLLMDGAGPTLEVLDASSGVRLFNYQTGGTIHGAPSVSGGEIFAGSVDVSSTPSASARPEGVPPGWSCADIGSPAVAGGQSLSGGTWSVIGGGGTVSKRLAVASPQALSVQPLTLGLGEWLSGTAGVWAVV